MPAVDMPVKLAARQDICFVVIQDDGWKKSVTKRGRLETRCEYLIGKQRQLVGQKVSGVLCM